MWVEFNVFSTMTTRRQRRVELYLEDIFTEDQIDQLGIRDMDESELEDLLSDRLFGADLEWPEEKGSLVNIVAGTYAEIMDNESDEVEEVEIDVFDPDEEA